MRAAAAVLTVTVATVLLYPSAASAHTLDSSSVRLVETDDGLDGTVSLAVASLDEAFDTAHRSDVLAPDVYAAQVIRYVDDHLTIQGSDSTTWGETYSNLVRQETDGIETITLDVTADADGADPGDFAVTFDAIIEAVPDHEAVLILETSSGSVSTPGVFTSTNESVVIGDGSTEVGTIDMVRFGYHHVLDGADHLLFLITLLLPAPFVGAAGRWRRGPGVRTTLRKVAHVITAFTIGHSLTLIATALGWITAPGRPVEVLIAASVALSALHAVRPIVRGGEPVIAATFGLIHGMAFAGILRDLGLEGRTSVLALLAFNIGIELAQFVTAAALFPSLYLLSTRAAAYRVRIIGASIALVAALAWMLDRMDVLANPLEPIERAVIDQPWWLVASLALLAAVVSITGQRRSAVAAVS